VRAVLILAALRVVLVEGALLAVCFGYARCVSVPDRRVVRVARALRAVLF